MRNLFLANVFILVALSFCFSCNSGENKKEEFQDDSKNLGKPDDLRNVELKKVNYSKGGVFVYLPKELEIQSESYKDDKQKRALENEIEIIDLEEMIFQQKGLNGGDSVALSDFVRITFETINGKDGEFKPYLETDIGENYIDVIKEINGIFYNQFLEMPVNEEFIVYDFINVDTLLRKNISGFQFGYFRKIKNKPEVKVYIYKILANDKLITVTCSCRSRSLSKWQPIFNKVINSIEFYSDASKNEWNEDDIQMLREIMQISDNVDMIENQYNLSMDDFLNCYIEKVTNGVNRLDFSKENVNTNKELQIKLANYFSLCVKELTH